MESNAGEEVNTSKEETQVKSNESEKAEKDSSVEKKQEYEKDHPAEIVVDKLTNEKEIIGEIKDIPISDIKSAHKTVHSFESERKESISSLSKFEMKTDNTMLNVSEEVKTDNQSVRKKN